MRKANIILTINTINDTTNNSLKNTIPLKVIHNSNNVENANHKHVMKNKQNPRQSNYMETL